MNKYHIFGTLIPVAKWGIDSLGPFPKALAGKNHLIVTIDHFTRWIEAKALASITPRKVKKFFYEDIICRFGILKILISNTTSSLILRSFEVFAKSWGLNKDSHMWDTLR